MEDSTFKVLVIDDEILQWRIYEVALNTLQCESDFAAESDAAKLKVAKEAFDLILLDLGLPPAPSDPVDEDISDIARGERLFYYLRSVTNVPIVVVTVYHCSLQGREALARMKPDGIFSKPGFQEELQSVIKVLLKM